MRTRFKYLGPRRGHFLREWRLRAGLSQDRLAALSGMSKPNISRIENGEIPYNEDTLEALANALGVGPADILMPPAMRADEILSVWNQLRDSDKGRAVASLEAAFRLSPRRPSAPRRPRKRPD